jgi:hypothetical protein
MSRRGLAANGPHHVSDRGVVQLRPVYGVGGPGWLHEGAHECVCSGRRSYSRLLVEYVAVVADDCSFL